MLTKHDYFWTVYVVPVLWQFEIVLPDLSWIFTFVYFFVFIFNSVLSSCLFPVIFLALQSAHVTSYF